MPSLNPFGSRAKLFNFVVPTAVIESVLARSLNPAMVPSAAKSWNDPIRPDFFCVFGARGGQADSMTGGFRPGDWRAAPESKASLSAQDDKIIVPPSCRPTQQRH